jgi:hypothetical protein
MWPAGYNPYLQLGDIFRPEAQKEPLGGLRTTRMQDVSVRLRNRSVNTTQNEKLTSAPVEKIECLGTTRRDQ